MPRLFVDDHSFQLCKTGHRHCGDAVFVTRRQNSTIAILADGMVSGIEAMVAATLSAEYLKACGNPDQKQSSCGTSREAPRSKETCSRQEAVTAIFFCSADAWLLKSIASGSFLLSDTAHGPTPSTGSVPG